MIKIHRDQCPDYERMADMCAMPPTQEDLVIWRREQMSHKVIEDAVHTSETGESAKVKRSKTNKSGRGENALRVHKPLQY